MKHFLFDPFPLSLNHRITFTQGYVFNQKTLSRVQFVSECVLRNDFFIEKWGEGIDKARWNFGNDDCFHQKFIALTTSRRSAKHWFFQIKRLIDKFMLIFSFFLFYQPVPSVKTTQTFGRWINLYKSIECRVDLSDSVAFSKLKTILDPISSSEHIRRDKCSFEVLPETHSSDMAFSFIWKWIESLFISLGTPETDADSKENLFQFRERRQKLFCFQQIGSKVCVTFPIYNFCSSLW